MLVGLIANRDIGLTDCGFYLFSRVVDDKKIDEYVLFLKFAYSDEIAVKTIDVSQAQKHFKR